jgi:hypothetical protein
VRQYPRRNTQFTTITLIMSSTKPTIKKELAADKGVLNKLKAGRIEKVSPPIQSTAKVQRAHVIDFGR